MKIIASIAALAALAAIALLAALEAFFHPIKALDNMEDDL
jgi:hypothetical protein